MKVLVTGGGGFIGRSLIAELVRRGIGVRATSRNVCAGMLEHPNLEWIEIESIGRCSEWPMALSGVDAVIHLAARAHILRESAADPEAAFFETNLEGTLGLAHACVGRVNRFIYLSSIGVHGSATHASALDESSVIAPDNPYARSKADAELCLQELAADGELDSRILRPPLVYGPDAPGNLARLVSAVRRGMPLPLSAVNNRRSLVGVAHLVSAIVALLMAENVSRSAYVVADREVVSTADMVRAIAQGLDRSPRLWALPPAMLRGLGIAAGRQSTVDQVVGDLEVDASNFRDEFGDLQPFSTLKGLADAAGAYKR